MTKGAAAASGEFGIKIRESVAADASCIETIRLRLLIVSTSLRNFLSEELFFCSTYVHTNTMIAKFLTAVVAAGLITSAASFDCKRSEEFGFLPTCCRGINGQVGTECRLLNTEYPIS